jgi:hypothetical protein
MIRTKKDKKLSNNKIFYFEKIEHNCKLPHILFYHFVQFIQFCIDHYYLYFLFD